MKILIAVLSCKKDQVYHQQARETWLANCPVDYKFFLGRLAFAYDEIEVDAPDTYRHLGDKVKRIKHKERCRSTSVNTGLTRPLVELADTAHLKRADSYGGVQVRFLYGRPNGKTSSSGRNVVVSEISF